MVARVQAQRGRLLSAAATLTAGDDVVLVTTSGGSVTLTLPLASKHQGHTFVVKKMSAANTLTVQRSGSDTIDGATTLAWTTQYAARAVTSVLVTAPATWGWVVTGGYL